MEAVTSITERSPDASTAYGGDEILIDLAEVRRITGKGTTSIYAGIKEDSFPAPVKDGKNSRWLLREVLEYNRRLVRERDALKKAA
jgi:prophage regulatory protein